MKRELPPGYSEAPQTRDLPPGYSLAQTKEEPSFIEASVAGAGNVLRQSVGSDSDILSNRPTGLLGTLARATPAAAGAMAGAAAAAPYGAPFGLPGVALAGLGGAYIGATGMESARQALVQANNAATGREFTPAGEVLGQVNRAGLENAAGEGAGQAIGAGVRAVRPALNKAGGAIFKLFANVDEKSGAAVAADPSLLLRAPSDDAVSKAYDSFHSASGTTSRREFIAKSDDPFDTVSRAMDTMRDAYNKLRDGTLSIQEAVNASQAGRIIRDMRSRGVEMAQQVSEQAQGLKTQFDDFIEKGGPPVGPQTKFTYIAGQKIPYQNPQIQPPGYPEWRAARRAAWENEVAGDFGSALPRNINGQPNVARFWGALTSGVTSGAATGGAIGGVPGAAVGAVLGGLGGAAVVSPLAYGTALKGAALLGKVPGAVYRVAPQAATASALEQAYMSRRERPALP